MVVFLFLTYEPAENRCFMEESKLFTEDAKRRLERMWVVIKIVCWLSIQKFGSH